MTFYQSRAISKTGLHVRRASWPDDHWFMIWRGTWFAFAGGNPPRPVRATDYSADDLLATDWTTVPATLAACPVDPAIGSTGGADPIPGVTPGFPDDPTPRIAGGSGGVSGSGAPSAPGAPTVLPPPDPGTGISVSFSGIISADVPGLITGVDLNQTFTFSASGGTQTFTSGLDAVSSPFAWDVSASRAGSLWTVSITARIPGDPSGGFQTLTPQAAGHPIDNLFTTLTGDFAHAGTATVGAG